MVSLTSLWLPILLSAVIVFVASSLIHMVLGYHKHDIRTLPKEAEVMTALRAFNIPPGDYLMPCAGGPSQMKSPAFLEKMNKGPVLVMTVMPSGQFTMGPTLAAWFLYCLVVSIFAAYVTRSAIGPGATGHIAFHFASITAFIGYALALWQNTIWYKRSWMTTMKSTIDGIVYGIVTGLAFAWLWPA